MSSATIQARPALVRAVVAVMLAHFLALLAMAASPGLHELAHHDGHDEEEETHHCVVSDMLSGGTGDGVPPRSFKVAANLPHQFFSVAEFDPQWIASLFLTGCVLEHAPPAQA